MDRKGKESTICEVETSHGVVSQAIALNDVQKVFEHWQAMMNHPKSKLDKKRRNRVEAALKMGYSAEELKQAIDGCSKTPFNQGQNDRGQRYDDIELILRDASHIDRFIQNAINPPTANIKTSSATNSMEGVI